MPRCTDQKQAADVEVLDAFAASWTPSSRCGHQYDQVYAADTGQHVADKTFVARHIDEAKTNFFVPGAVQIEVCKAKIDGDAAALLFLEPVRVGSGQRPHQGTLSVVDMARSADDDGLHAPKCNGRFVELREGIG